MVLISFLGNAQDTKKTEESAPKKDTIKPKTERYGLRVGIQASTNLHVHFMIKIIEG